MILEFQLRKERSRKIASFMSSLVPFCYQTCITLPHFSNLEKKNSIYDCPHQVYSICTCRHDCRIVVFILFWSHVRPFNALSLLIVESLLLFEVYFCIIFFSLISNFQFNYMFTLWRPY